MLNILKFFRIMAYFGSKRGEWNYSCKLSFSTHPVITEKNLRLFNKGHLEIPVILQSIYVGI